MFLNYLKPATSISEAKDILRVMYDNWRFVYFSKIHYICIALISAVAAFFFFRKPITVKHRRIWLFTSILISGMLVFFVAMMEQYRDHDYYFLDSFFLPLFLLLILLTTLIPENTNKIYQTILLMLPLGLCIPLISNGYAQLKNDIRLEHEWDRTQTTIRNYTGAEKILDSLHIGKDAKILAIDTYTPNIPFILMKRHGYAVMTTSRENIENALKWDYDYFIVQKDFFVTDVYQNYPEILGMAQKVYENSGIVICKKSNTQLKQNISEFMGYPQNR